ncbi:ATP-binding protein [Geodermatophilus sp. FMUSA9-8]|uniref:ATP-binding protein n=1 Tax=Geodermatophilus sp. FMUSA9-8 TaxID=3120155 RepID=UPI003008B195
MDHSSWAQRPPPVPGPGRAAMWHGQPGTAAELTAMRRRLRTVLADGELPAGADDGERLLLAVEELASNGLRHGRPPVDVTVTAAVTGWLLQVRDTAAAQPPTPAIGRDAALGGMGLHLVARLSRAHGWDLDGEHKTVWAHITYRMPPAPPSQQRIRAATARARDLTACLAATEARIAGTLQRMAADAAAAGRTEHADAWCAVAERASRDAERAHRMSLTPLPAPAPRRDRSPRSTAGRPPRTADPDRPGPVLPAR